MYEGTYTTKLVRSSAVISEGGCLQTMTLWSSLAIQRSVQICMPCTTRGRWRGSSSLGTPWKSTTYNEWRSRKQGFSNMTRVFSYINNAIFDPTARHSMLSMGLLSCCLGERHRSRAPFFLPRGILRFYLSPAMPTPCAARVTIL